MKNLKKTVYKALCGLALVLLIAGCADILNSPAAPEAKPGRITLTVGAGPARTAAPALDQFKKILLAIESQDGAVNLADVDASSGSAEVELPLGVWNITAKAYLDVEGKNLAAASAPHEFSWDGVDLSYEDARFLLLPTGDGPGTLLYTITVPGAVTLAGTGSRIQIELNGAVFEDLADDNFTAGVHDITDSEEDVAVSLPAGRYVADILLKNESGETVEFRESVVILPGLVTKLRYEPHKEAFLDPEVRALITETDSLAFNPTQGDEVGIVIDELISTQDPFVYKLTINAPGETNPVYFTLAKPEEYSVSIDGEGDGALVSAYANGEGAEGEEAGPELAVFRVDTSSVVDQGDDLCFALILEHEGKLPVTIAVTLTVDPPPLPMLWIDQSTNETEDLEAVPDQKSIVNLTQALEWIKTNAQSNKKYVVLLSRPGQGEMTAAYDSKTGVSNVRITLRGVDEIQQVYTNASLSIAGLLTLNTGTTLVLDENITLDGREIRLNNPGGSGKHFVHVKGGVLEMKTGSRITRHYDNPATAATCSVFVQTGTFNMSGGVIDKTDGLRAVVWVRNGSFAMWDGAKITNNNLLKAETIFSSHHTGGTGVQYGTIAAVVIGDASTLTSGVLNFTMHGGEISNTNYRGVFLYRPASGSLKCTFVMEGGVIKNNGKTGLIGSGTPTYPYGGGIFIMGVRTVFRMESGEISDNGNTVGSGIFVDGNITLDSIVLNGPVVIENNSLAFRTAETIYSGLKIGPNFSTEKSLNIELCNDSSEVDSAAIRTNLIAWWTGKQLLTALNSNDQTIAFDNSALAAKFSLTKYFFVPKSNNVVSLYPVEYLDISGSIDQYGVVTLASTSQ
jgi:hypothetical protein